MYCFDKENIEDIVPGYWYREPGPDWYTESVAISRGEAKKDKEKRILFLAIDDHTWHEGSGNTGIYAGWQDKHDTIINFQGLVDGIIAQRPIPELDINIPQYITENTYEVIKILADCSFENFKGQAIAITGTAGKSTSKNLLKMLLEKYHSVVATRGNHNTRTGVPLTISSAITQPDFLVVESAISGLWTNPHGIMKKFPPTVAVITSIDGGQRKNAHQTAILKARIAEGMGGRGKVILNRDMNEFETVLESVKRYNQNIITYGFSESADSRVLMYEELKIGSTVKASILGEKVRFTTKLNGSAMISNIMAVLTVIKILGIKLSSVVEYIKDFEPAEGVLNFESHKKHDGSYFTILDDGWNATGIGMIEAIKITGKKAKYFNGTKMAVIGRIENLGHEESIRQHEALAKPLMDAGIDIVFAHGPEMKHTLKLLPEHMIGGHFENSKEVAEHVGNIIGEDDLILIKGSPRSSNFKFVKRDILSLTANSPEKMNRTHLNKDSTGSGAATFNMNNGQKIGTSGDQSVTQNHGLGGILLINHILEKIFSDQMSLHDEYLPGRQELKENKAQNSLKLIKEEPVKLERLLNSVIVVNSPNAMLMLANQVIGSNRKTLQILRQKMRELMLENNSVLNITGRRISGREQKATLKDMYIVGKELFSKFPFILDLLASKYFIHNKREYRTSSNLYSYGVISHGLFFGHLDSLGIVLSQKGADKFITVVAGARDAYHRDQLILDSLSETEQQSQVPINEVEKIETENEYKINIIGDTYFGEFYSDIRKKRHREDALMTKGHAYSFDGIRELLFDGDFNISNFEAAISEKKEHIMKSRKPFVLYSEHSAVEAIKTEKFDMVTLANNHLMDCGVEGLNDTIKEFNNKDIFTLGAGMNQKEAERFYAKNVNKKRIAIFNAYWHRRPMYREFDFYAIDSRPGVASLSGNILDQIKEEKKTHPNGKIIVIAHWGADFKTVSPKQREYAHSLVDAGADIIIGHGAHMIQEIEKIDSSIVLYSIGNGVFNSDGEYNSRFVAPYSLIAQIVMKQTGIELRLYPIYTNNLKTFWQPRFLQDKEFNHCTLMLKSFGSTNLDLKVSDDKNYYSFKID